MKHSKFLFAALLAALLLGLTACGQQDTNVSAPPEEQEEPAQAPVMRPEETNAPEESTDPTSGKVLVVYYSATGSTEAVAGYITDTLGAETFEIVPAEPYTSDDLNWRDSSSRVSREHDDPALRTMELEETSVEGWADYDTVFIGYPIWWGIAAWPVDNFITANDFTRKTVIPFCTSSSSGLGDSGKLLADLAGAGTWLEGQRFRSSVSEADVIDWVTSLEITG